jgi:glyoxylase-like metal-dependent hydrolase (beta-lactamase superfamily II)
VLPGGSQRDAPFGRPSPLDAGREELAQAALRDTTSAGFADELRKNGIPGEVIATRGHSPDSVTFVTSQGEALIGDLGPADQILAHDVASKESWEAIRAKGATKFYPTHAQVFEILA